MDPKYWVGLLALPIVAWLGILSVRAIADAPPPIDAGQIVVKICADVSDDANDYLSGDEIVARLSAADFGLDAGLAHVVLDDVLEDTADRFLFNVRLTGGAAQVTVSNAGAAAPPVGIGLDRVYVARVAVEDVDRKEATLDVGGFRILVALAIHGVSSTAA